MTVYEDGKQRSKSVNILISCFVKRDFANLGHNGLCFVDASILKSLFILVSTPSRSNFDKSVLYHKVNHNVTCVPKKKDHRIAVTLTHKHKMADIIIGILLLHCGQWMEVETRHPCFHTSMVDINNAKNDINCVVVSMCGLDD